MIFKFKSMLDLKKMPIHTRAVHEPQYASYVEMEFKKYKLREIKIGTYNCVYTFTCSEIYTQIKE